ncbi:OmpH family outer membrane protein [Tropicibacter alexandrii]|uniref:OmpH family outer membrane protein n=1 Tax=Tropicibacter alexandrii TaxID=2267683 RepID=UPI000EF543CE|nr:OmpH family outer membrane protein [Tropicibacter alexandrii]
MRVLAILTVCLGALAPGAHAQNIGGPLSQGVVQSPILVIEFDRVYAESAFGQRITRELEEEGARIAAENREIEAQLIEEERRLTEERATMDPVRFRELADEFDARVQRVRTERDAMARELGTRNEEARRRFVSAVQPVIEQLMRASGAAVILDRRSVFVASDAVDVTDRAIEGIDARIGEGVDLVPDPAAGISDN